MKTYTGGCHCERVRFEVAVDLSQSITCNCSICKKRGSILAFTPAEQFKLIKGEGELTEYLFATKTIHHLFCKTCGILPYGKGQMPDGTKMIAVNARCLDGIEIEKLSPVAVDGASA